MQESLYTAIERYAINNISLIHTDADSAHSQAHATTATHGTYDALVVAHLYAAICCVNVGIVSDVGVCVCAW